MKCCSLSFHSQFFASGVFPSYSITSFFCCSPLLTCLTNSPEMNRVKRHHYVCVTDLIMNSLSTLLFFFNFIFHDPPHGVHIVISGERERYTKDKTQEKWRSSRKERILSIFHLFPSPHCFLMLFIFSPFSCKSQTLQ